MKTLISKEEECKGGRINEKGILLSFYYGQKINFLHDVLTINLIIIDEMIFPNIFDKFEKAQYDKKKIVASQLSVNRL